MRVKLRATLLALLLATAGGLIVTGVAMRSESAAFVVAGVLLAGFAFLTLAETP